MDKFKEVKFVDYGVANNYGDLIEFHKDLIDYPDLFEPIVKHEFAHSDEKKFSWKELKHDIMPSGLYVKDLMMFMIARPKTFWQFAPFFWHERKGFVYAINLIIFYCSIILMGGIITLILI